MPVPGGTTRRLANACCAQRSSRYRSSLRAYSISTLRANASAVPKASTVTEWSITRSTGSSGSSRPPPRVGHRVAHRRQIDDGGHTGEVLHQHPRRTEGDLALGAAAPSGQRGDVVGADERRALVAKQVLEQDLQRVREPGDTELGLQAVQPEDLVVAVTDAQRRSRPEAVAHGAHLP